jgi:hypothetical protein
MANKRRSREELKAVEPESQRMLGLAKWEEVMRIAGDLFLDTQMFPARSYVSKFPTDEQLASVIRKQGI